MEDCDVVRTGGPGDADVLGDFLSRGVHRRLLSPDLHLHEQPRLRTASRALGEGPVRGRTAMDPWRPRVGSPRRAFRGARRMADEALPRRREWRRLV